MISRQWIARPSPSEHVSDLLRGRRSPMREPEEVRPSRYSSCATEPAGALSEVDELIAVEGSEGTLLAARATGEIVAEA